MKYFVPLALLAVALVAADKPADKKTDKELLQGAWVVVTIEAKGEVLKAGDLFEQLKDMKLTFTGDSVTNSRHPDGKGTFKLDPDKKPPAVDVVMTVGQETRTHRAVYELKGDTMRVCSARGEGERPTEFTSKGDLLILTFKRDKETDAANERATLAQTKLLTLACENYKLDIGEFPPSLEALPNNKPNGGKPIIEAAALIPKVGGVFKYDPAGPRNSGLKPDIWVKGPNGDIGNWMKELKREEKKPEK
jgi:uncharacterized protein (TIGR03067 family)